MSEGETPTCPNYEASVLSLLTEQLNRSHRPIHRRSHFQYSAHSSLMLPLFTSALFFPTSPLFLSRYLFLLPKLLFPLLSSLVPGRHGDSAFPPPATRIPIRLVALTNTHKTQTHTHARTATVWCCQRPDESNDRLKSVYRPQLTSPWGAHKQLISPLLMSSSFSCPLLFACSSCLFSLSSFPLFLLVWSNWICTIVQLLEVIFYWPELTLG